MEKAYGLEIPQTLAEVCHPERMALLVYDLQVGIMSQLPQEKREYITKKAFNTMAQEVFELAPKHLKEYNVSVFVASDDPAARETVMNLAQDIGFAPVDCGELRFARLIEGLGDFIRYLMISQKFGSYATISVETLPEAQNQRLGGRQSSSLY